MPYSAELYDRDHYSEDGLYRLQLKLETFNAYGGCRCDWCGVSDPVVLTLDHIGQDGAERHRQGEPRGSALLYKWLKDHGYPPGYRVLCYNHNIMAAWLAQRGIHQNRAGDPVDTPSRPLKRSMADVAEELGFCESTIRVWIARTLRGETTATAATTTLPVNAGPRTLVDVAQELGFSEATLRQWIKMSKDECVIEPVIDR